jgi:predicted phage terminase large subunit-like protein
MEISDQEICSVLRENLTAFTEKVFTHVDPGAEYLPNWHINLIAEYLKACQNGDIKRLIINIPPRHLKSISVAVAFPAWLLGQNPTEQIMCASYSQELSFKHSMDCRLVVESDWYQLLFPNTKIVSDQNTQRKFVTTQRGFRIATSVGGTATGEGGNFLIVDDPISSQQADSTVMRENANIWFDRTYSSRLNDKKKGCIIVIMQRFHEEDLTGHLLKKGGWEHLCIPLIAEEDSLVEKGGVRKFRKTGEILHPERMDEAAIAQVKAETGAYAFAGQYQQRPSPEGGGMFRKEWIQYYDKIHHDQFVKYMFVDPAYTKTADSDYTAIWIIGAGEDNNLYVIDIVRDKLNPREKEDLVFDLHRKYNPQVHYEAGGTQRDADWLKSAMEDRNYRFPIYEAKCPRSLSKRDRIGRLIRYFAEHKIYFPRFLYKSDWEGKLVDVVDAFVQQEYLQFPVSKHDDLLDALSRLCDITIAYPGKHNIDYYKIYGVKR